MKYKNLFFDLDDTIWAFSRNARDTFEEVYQKYSFDRYFDSFEHYYTLYQRRNTELWLEYGEGKVTKEELNRQRFFYPLQAVGVEDEALAERFSEDFFAIIPTKSGLMPHAKEVLEYLAPQYNLYILSNGFRELQSRKMRSAGVDRYFKKIILSEDLGVLKPWPEIFHFALSATQSELRESLMIGDSWEADITGAHGVGMHQFYGLSRIFVASNKCIKYDNIMDSTLLPFALLCFTSFFTLTNPLGTMPVFLTMTHGMTDKERQTIVRRATIVSFITLMVFVFAGQFLFKFFGISTNGFRIAGGVIIFKIGFDMLQARYTPMKLKDEEIKTYADDISITPLGIPMLCGPGAIANAIVLMQDSHTYAMKGILIGTIALIYLLTFFILRASTRLVKVLGETGNNVMMRLMGLILMVIAVECFVSGAKPILADIVREGLSGICK